jgi:serine/threonine-protein kinase
MTAPHSTQAFPPDENRSWPAPEAATLAGPAPAVVGEGPSVPGYEIVEMLGRGGMGIVYKAQQLGLNRFVALKMILAGELAGPGDVSRFRSEAEAVARLQHPNIVQIYEVGEQAGRPYFSLEFVDGGSLAQQLDGTPWPAAKAAALAETLARAVHAAHLKGIVHRDLKPANILLQTDGTPKITDFGLAKRLDIEKGQTQSGAIMGTPSYMAPEQAGGSHNRASQGNAQIVGPAADVYGLGAILYELLTGRPPFKAATPLDTVLQVLSDEPLPPSRLNSKVSRDLETICLKCLQKQLGRRYPSALALAEDIGRFRAGEPIVARPVGIVERSGRWARKHPAASLLYATLCCVAVALLVGLPYVSWRESVLRRTAEQHEATAKENGARTESSFRMARDTVDRLFTQVADSPQLKAQGMERFRKSLLQNVKEFYERFIREQFDAPEVRHDLGVAHYRLAKIHEVVGDYAAAQTLSEKAIEILGALVRSHADRPEYQRDLAAGYFGLAAVYYDTRLVDRAEAAYQEALAIHERLVRDHPEVAEYRRGLAMTQSDLGLLHHRATRLEKARASLESALAIWSRLVANATQVPEDRHGLATVQQRLGDTYRASSQSQKAEAILKGAASTLQTLVRDYPYLPEYRDALGRTYFSLGLVYHDNLGRAKSAAVAHQLALQIFEKLVQEHPDVLEYGYRVGLCYHALVLDAVLGGWQAPGLDEKAIEILERVVSRGYGQARDELLNVRIARATTLPHARTSDELEAIARLEGLSSVNLYNIACVFSGCSERAENDRKLSPTDRARLKEQYAGRAMDFLRQALARGFQDAALLKTDKDLVPLRSRGDFRRLVQELEQKTRK